LKRLDLPTRNEIRALNKRIARLERELATRDSESTKDQPASTEQT
jgi:hypothetical protein